MLAGIESLAGIVFVLDEVLEENPDHGGNLLYSKRLLCTILKTFLDSSSKKFRVSCS